MSLIPDCTVASISRAVSIQQTRNSPNGQSREEERERRKGEKRGGEGRRGEMKIGEERREEEVWGGKERTGGGCTGSLSSPLRHRPPSITGKPI